MTGQPGKQQIVGRDHVNETQAYLRLTLRFSQDRHHHYSSHTLETCISRMMLNIQGFGTGILFSNVTVSNE
jgi:hypothetical protein